MNREEISSAINRAMRSLDIERNPEVWHVWNSIGGVGKDLFVAAMTDALLGEKIRWGFKDGPMSAPLDRV